MANYKLANGNIIVADQGFIDKFYPGAERLPDAIPDPDDAINQQLAAIDASTGMTRLSRELWVLQLGV